MLPSPLYQQVAGSLREDIISGTYKYGSQLPSQKELAETFTVSLITIKRALYELVQENLLYSQPGKGIFVGLLSLPAKH
ncbi:GntR family transcriptional regulator [candidate division KSB1 bacterium]|nr:GntR family transcriptional regulator [candidate division KSB1 bacterium]